MIQNSGKRMAELMEGVLLFSQLEAGRLAFNDPQPINVAACCEQIVTEMENAAARRCAVTLTTADLPNPLRVDESLLRHILTNLLSNAVKYSSPGSPIILGMRFEQSQLIMGVQDHQAFDPATGH